MVARAGSDPLPKYDTSPIILRDAIRNLKALVTGAHRLTERTTVRDWLIQLTTVRVCVEIFYLYVTCTLSSVL